MNMDLLEMYRKEQRYTVTQFCKEIGCDMSTYYTWKKYPDRMKLSTANKIAEILKLNKSQRSDLLQ